MTNPGNWLRERREELHLTRVGIERLTKESASRAANERYRIRRGRLADIEDGHSPPDIFEVASLSECYKVPYPSVLRAFGLQLTEDPNIVTRPMETRPPQNSWSFTDIDRPFSLKFQTSISYDTTRLVTESPEELGIPSAVRRELDDADFRFGIVGINDDTMGELVPAGSVVVIDKSRTAVEMGDWRSIRERPIYFVWHENGYSCSWCFLGRETLFIVPYPTSRQPVMIFKTPRAASIIGQVIHVWPPLIIPRHG
jgi:transcriptional regulator with XRE-family HTH domain